MIRVLQEEVKDNQVKLKNMKNSKKQKRRLI